MIIAAGWEITDDRAPVLAYITRGSGMINGENMANGGLVSGKHLLFQADEASQLIVIHSKS